MPFIAISKDQDKAIIYYSEVSTMTTKIKGLQRGDCHTTWFNPRTGEYTPNPEKLISIDGEWEFPIKKDNSDWLLVVEKK